MTDIIVYGPPQSSYVRTARIVLAEKGVACELAPIEFGSPEHLALHPFGRVPAMRHGDVTLFETFGITRYIDETFDGPALQPADPLERAQMTQWISAIVDSVYPATIRGYLMHYVRATMSGSAPDRAAIDASLDALKSTLQTLDKALAGRSSIVGGATSLADWFLLPIVFYMTQSPEGGEIMKSCAGLTAWYEGLAGRPSAQQTLPPPPPAAAAA